MAGLYKRFKQLPIAKKITALNFLNCLIGFAVAGAILFIIDLNSYRQLLERNLLSLSSLVATYSKSAIINTNSALAEKNLAALNKQQSIVSACIYQSKLGADKTNIRILAVHPTPNSSCPIRQPGTVKIIKTHFWSSVEIYQPVINEKTIIGYIYIKKGIASYASRVQQSLTLTLSTLAFVLIISLMLARLFSKLIATPITELDKAARKVTETKNYSLRAEKLSTDEIGNMVDSFNNMLGAIESNHKKVRESEEKFKLISSSSKAGIFQLDTDGKCIYANNEILSISNLDEETFTFDNWLTRIHTNDRLLFEQKYQQMMSEKASINIDCRLVVHSEIKWLSGHIDPLTDSNGNLMGYLGTMHDITAEKNTQLQLEKLAFYDTLTGLANRRLFRNRLDHVISNLARDNSKLGLILIDLDHFKNVNDTLGHDSGDALLTIIAERLQECVRASDTVARLGGDEFAIILPSTGSSLSISQVAEKIIHTVKKTITLNETEIHITASLGIATAPNDGKDAQTLIKHADLALYRAKDQGRDNYNFFTAELNKELNQHLKMVNELRHAIHNNEFNLEYQPQVDLESHRLTGMETLLRWHPKGKSPIAPADFIPVAEETGLIIPIGRWVISEACKTIHKLQFNRCISKDVVITINLSVKQFRDEQLVSFLAEKICENNIQPENVEIELTETVLMENLDDVIATLHAIKALGVMISIDDFGTGYSSMSYLQRLPLDILKVDRTFVKEIPENKDDMEIATAVIAMAHSLGYKVVAEGVETIEQLNFLKQCDCDQGQGYYFSKPLPFEALLQYCHDHHNLTDDERQIRLIDE